ncbi:barstar family protein [Aquipuribacter hungaricus]|uniref:Barstar family protein n=1 Tax=Aquipuribacter hungaricus TaxID=545624 RepID=A0ABV7WKN7_9MICO
MALSQLTALGYADRRVNLQGADETTMHQRSQERFDFPDYFGHNLAALHECLGDVTAGEFGWDPSSTGLAVAVPGFQDFAEREPGLAQKLVDTWVRTSREGLLFGHRVLWLLEFGAVAVNLQPVASVTVGPYVGPLGR